METNTTTALLCASGVARAITSIPVEERRLQAFGNAIAPIIEPSAFTMLIHNGSPCSWMQLGDLDPVDHELCGPYNELQITQFVALETSRLFEARVALEIDTYNLSRREAVEQLRDDGDPLFWRSFEFDAAVRHFLVCEGGTGEVGCDDAMSLEIEAWINKHPDAPGLHECLILARENAADMSVPPWMEPGEAQAEAWSVCAALEGELRYVEAMNIQLDAWRF